MKTVSVIIPTYNRADLVGTAVESVLCQTYSNFEVIIVDDGSRDNTSDIIREYTDSRIRYFYQENSGVSSARNLGIRLAKGEYLAFLDSDDLFCPEKLKMQVDQMESQPSLGAVFSGFQYIDQTGRALSLQWPWVFHPSLDLKTILFGCPITPAASLVKSTWIRRIGDFDTRIAYAEDINLWIRLAAAGCEMAWTRSILSKYRIHPGQTVQNENKEKIVTLRMLEQLFNEYDFPGDIITCQDEVFSSYLLTGALRGFAAGHIDDARASLKSVIKLNSSWLDNEGESFCECMLSLAANPIIGDPSNFIQSVLLNLPDVFGFLSSKRPILIYKAAVRAGLQSLSAGNKFRFQSILKNAAEIVPLEKKHHPEIMDYLEFCIRTFPEEIQLESLEMFFDNLPVEWIQFQKEKKTLLARLYMVRGFEKHIKGHQSEAARDLCRGIILDPHWLLNRGVISIIGRGIFS